MAGMREIRERIASVSEIMKITNAMYLISSSNLKKAKKRLENTEPYFEKLQSTIHHILLHTPEFEHKYFDQREEKKPEDKMIGYI
ncbi:F0F1 ATP synthase subunit gamma, partial [Ruminococcus bicirculans (ex Wegman et al. 2014)]|uniref:F0F1 ATP synthase subunit gamma n=2 Tax=Ruminococcus TaxID=1263 RepID=UPI003FD7E631